MNKYIRIIFLLISFVILVSCSEDGETIRKEGKAKIEKRINAKNKKYNAKQLSSLFGEDFYFGPKIFSFQAKDTISKYSNEVFKFRASLKDIKRLENTFTISANSYTNFYQIESTEPLIDRIVKDSIFYDDNLIFYVKLKSAERINLFEPNVSDYDVYENQLEDYIIDFESYDGFKFKCVLIDFLKVNSYYGFDFQ